MSLQSRVRCLDSIGHPAEISALPIAACLRRSASVLEILCLGRRTRRPRARAGMPQETTGSIFLGHVDITGRTTGSPHA